MGRVRIRKNMNAVNPYFIRTYGIFHEKCLFSYSGRRLQLRLRNQQKTERCFLKRNLLIGFSFFSNFCGICYFMEGKFSKVAIKLIRFFVIYYENAQRGIDKCYILWYHPSKAGNVSGNAFKSEQTGLACTGGRERGVDCDD